MLHTFTRGNRRAWLAPLVPLLLAACQDDLATSPDARDARAAEARPAAPGLQEDDPDRPAEWRSARLARAIPGYGGYAFDREGNIEVFLLDPKNERAAQAVSQALAPLLAEWNAGAPAQRRGGGRVLVREGQFTFAQLREWRDRIVLPLLHIPEVTFVDLDEARNRVTVGVDPRHSAGARGSVTRALATWGVPVAAVAFEDAPHHLAAQFTPGEFPTDVPTPELDARHRPLRGGQQIETDGYLTGEVARCSLGFSAYFYDQLVFVTASHCTKHIGQVDHAAFYQTTNRVSADYIGTENTDPVFSLNGFATVKIDGYTYACNDDNNSLTSPSYAGFYCRRSDAVLIGAYGGLSSGDVAFGQIAHTTCVSADINYSGCKNYVRSSPGIRINAERGAPQLYEILDKVGWATGWTRGAVQRICVDRRHVSGDPYDPNPTNIAFRCQHDVYATSFGGDSGGPVFAYNGSTNTATLHGILRAAAPGGGFSYTSMDMIRLDLQIAVGSTILDTY